MHYLIDGHNLIARMPDISLEDPDDEVQLILRLRSWAARSKKRQITLFFDGGIPGGKNVKLSTPQVRVIFASAGHTADALLINRIQKYKNPAEYVLITSDQQIIAAAGGRKMRHLTADKFARQLAEQWLDTPPGPTVTDDDPILSDAEVADWLATFGPVDEKALRRRPKPVPPNLPPPEPEPTAVATPIDREDPYLNANDVDEWLSLFGAEAKANKKKAKTEPKTTSAKSEPERSTPKPSSRPRSKTSNPHNLSPDDLAAWQDFAGQED